MANTKLIPTVLQKRYNWGIFFFSAIQKFGFRLYFLKNINTFILQRLITLIKSDGKDIYYNVTKADF